MKIERSICTSCHAMGAPKVVTPGSTLIEVILWCCFFVPGIVYSIWRLTSKTLACPSCGAAMMIPWATPRGSELVASRGGWNQQAEEPFILAARARWLRRIPWMAITSFFAIVFLAMGTQGAAVGGFLAIVAVIQGIAFARARPT